MKHTGKKTKNRKRDYDQLADDAQPEKAVKLLNQERDMDVPGDAQFYCLPCARYFVDNLALGAHQKSKQHKKQVNRIVDRGDYDHKESLAAAGFGSYYPPVKKLKKEDVDVRKEHFEMS